MAKSSRTDKPAEHVHYFSQITAKCACGAEKIDREELNRREAVWDDIYTKSKETPSYWGYVNCLEAFRAGDFAAVKDLAGQATERLKSGNYLPKPSFADPRFQHYDFDPEGKIVLRPL